jgi:hypothetical protein
MRVSLSSRRISPLVSNAKQLSASRRCDRRWQPQLRYQPLAARIRAADERLDDYLRRLDEGDVEEGGTGGGARARRHC